MTAACLLMAACLAAPSEISAPLDLRCEYLVDPLGIDASLPRLSWVLPSGERGLRQSAFRVLVAASRDALAADQGDLWDTGRVESSQSTQVTYAGKPLDSRQPCWWKVRFWNQSGQPSAWSEPARWTMGLLKSADWQGIWIGCVPPPAPVAKNSLLGSQWIWAPPEKADAPLPPGAHFRQHLTVPKDARIAKAEIMLTADDNYGLWVNGQELGRNRGLESWMRPDRYDVTSLFAPGDNLVAIRSGNSPGTPGGMVANIVVRLASGEVLEAPTGDTWKASARAPKDWAAPQTPDDSWPVAHRVGPFGMAPWGEVPVDPTLVPPSPYLRKAFALDKPVRTAMATICGLGYHELRLNGKRVGDHVLDPAFTRYDRRALYVTHDVTGLLTRGANVVGVQLGNGWYNEATRSAWNFDYAPWRDLPKVLFQLDVTYDDGTTARVVSDETWTTTSDGPTRFDGIRRGETYDARREIPGWDAPGFNDSSWVRARPVPPPRGVLSAQQMPPIRMVETITPKKLTEPAPGVFVFDLGQNLTGHARIRVSGPAGATVVLRYGERLNADGTVDQQAIREHVYGGDFQTDRYTLRGQGTEEWEPKFVYHGFQYIEVTGWPGRPSLESVAGRVVHTDFERTGAFSCSSDLLNRIEQNTVWSYVSNFHGYPTDCPHREKNGWTGDAHLAAEMGLLHFRGEAAYAKWLNDMADEQRPSGELAAIIPTSGWGYLWGNGPAWDSAYLLIPWYIYQYRGDSQILKQHYEHHKRYVDYLTTKADGHIVRIGLGDWVPAKTQTPVEVTSTAYYHVDTQIVARTAAMIGLKEDAEKYRRQAEAIRQAFNARFYDPATGRYANGSQTALSCALYQGLAEPANVSKVVQQLVAAVEGADNHLDTGILGAKYLLHALSDNGRADVALRVASQTTRPSWGDWLQQGATTLWEQWDGSASRNHIMFGDISAWFIRNLGGIAPDPQSPGFKHVIVRPRPLADLTWAKAEHCGPYGWIRTSWRLESGRFLLEVTIPSNSTATVWLPAGSLDGITESGQPVQQAPGVEKPRVEGGAVACEVASGTYHFASPHSRTN